MADRIALPEQKVVEGVEADSAKIASSAGEIPDGEQAEAAEGRPKGPRYLSIPWWWISLSGQK